MLLSCCAFLHTLCLPLYSTCLLRSTFLSTCTLTVILLPAHAANKNGLYRPSPLQQQPVRLDVKLCKSGCDHDVGICWPNTLILDPRHQSWPNCMTVLICSIRSRHGANFRLIVMHDCSACRRVGLS